MGANVLIRGHAKYILFYKIISYKIISVIVISVYVHLDDRAYDLPTTTSVTQATSDEYDNNSGSTTAAKTEVSVEHTRGYPDRQSHVQTTDPSAD